MDVTLDATHTYYCHNTSSEDTTRQIVDQHRKVILFTEFLQQYVPGFENCVLEHFADMNGVRESRRIAGEYVMKGEDIASARKFDDGVVIFPEVFDSHHPTSNNYTAMRHIHLAKPVENAVCRPSQDDDDLNMHPFAQMEGYEIRQNPRCFCEIPYRSLVAQGVTNLLAAGRDFSADWHTVGAARVIATSMSMGQAAGNAADYAIRHQLKLNEVDGRAIRQIMKKQGAYYRKKLLDATNAVGDKVGMVVISPIYALVAILVTALVLPILGVGINAASQAM